MKKATIHEGKNRKNVILRMYEYSIMGTFAVHWAFGSVLYTCATVFINFDV